MAFRFLAADQAPDYRSIARFRRRHLQALAGLFTQSLHLAQRLGMVKMGRVALDGTKLRANASKHKAMSYARLVDKEAQVEAEVADLEAAVADLLTDAEATDAAEDARFGPDGKDVDLPAELDRREKRLARLQAARAQIEAEAAAKARAKAEAGEVARQQRAGSADADAVAAAGNRAADKAKPKPKAQANFTDPQSRIMKNSDGAYMQAYNGQAVVDDAHQIITAADITDCASATARTDSTKKLRRSIRTGIMVHERRVESAIRPSLRYPLIGYDRATRSRYVYLILHRRYRQRGGSGITGTSDRNRFKPVGAPIADVHGES